MPRDREQQRSGDVGSASRRDEDTGSLDVAPWFAPRTPTQGILQLQTGAGNAAVARMLARQATDTGNDRPAVAKESVKRIVGEHPGLDDMLLNWSFGKGESYLTGFYKGMAKGPTFSAVKVWKKPSQWGELDMDVPFKAIKYPEATGNFNDDLENLEKAAAGVEERHIKMVGRFLQSMESGSGMLGFLTRSDDLSVTLDAVEWWEGRPIVLRSWQARVLIEGRDSPAIKDIAEQARERSPSGDAPPGKSRGA